MAWNAVRCGAMVAATILLAGCDDGLKNLVDAHFPPADFTEQALISLEQSRASLGTLGDANFSISLHNRDITPPLSVALAERVPDLKEPELSFGPQRIGISAGFERTFTDEKITVKGALVGVALVAIDGEEIVVTPSFLSLRLDGLSWRGRDATGIAPILNAALREFIANVNGRIEPVRVKIDLARSFSFDIAEAIANSPAVNAVEGQPVEGELRLAAAAVLVDSDGVHVLGRAALRSGPISHAEILAFCSTPPAVPTIDCPSGPAKPFCEIQKAARIKKAELDVKAHEAACAKEIPAVLAIESIQPRTSEMFDRLWSRMRDSFFAQRMAMTGPDEAMKGKSHAVVSKAVIASSINTLLGEPSIQVKLALAPPPHPFSEDIRLEKAPNLKCRENLRSCNIVQNCSRSECKGWDCSYNCKKWQVDCHARKLGCETNKAAAIKSCQATEAIKKLSCEGDRAAKRLDCERLKGMEIAGCEINQAWLNEWSEHKVGKIDGTVDMATEIRGVLRTIKIADDLSTAEIAMGLAGIARVAADLRFTPAGVGNVGCQARWSGRIEAAGVFRDENLHLKGDLRFVNAEAELPARIMLAMPARKVAFQVVPPPLNALLDQNPNFSVVCFPANVAGRAAQLVSRLSGKAPPEISGKYEKDLDPLDLSIPVRPLPVILTGKATKKERTVLLAPIWLPRAVGFTIR